MAILEVNNVKKIYTTRFGGNQVQALSNINFSVEKGEYVDFCEEGKKSILVVNMKAAWNIEEQPYIEMSKKYNLDFRVYGYEMGMEFNKEIEIVEGEIATYRLIQFKDYKWECPDPELGG